MTSPSRRPSHLLAYSETFFGCGVVWNLGSADDRVQDEYFKTAKDAGVAGSALHIGVDGCAFTIGVDGFASNIGVADLSNTWSNGGVGME